MLDHRHRGSRLIAVLAALLFLGWVASAAADPVAFQLGISDPVNTVLPLWMAETGGFYRDQGLKLEIINMNGGSRGAKELQAGNIDAMHVGLSSVVRSNEAGGDLRVIASLSNVIRFTFFSAAGVRSASDLKGGVVGVSSFGSESDATVTLALKELGLTRRDVVIKELGGGMQRLAALKSGSIKASAINEPIASLARAQGINPMVDLAAERIPWLFSGIVVRKAYLDSHRALLTRFLKAMIEGCYLAFADEKGAKEVLARETKIADPKVIEISYDDFKQQTPTDAEPTKAVAENVIAQFAAVGIVLKSTNVDDYVDTSILDGLKKDGFIAALERKYGKR